MKLDLANAGSTTILQCGKSNAGHYAIVQQGLNSFVSDDVGKVVFGILEEYAPVPPGEGWKLHSMEMADYKSRERGQYYKIYIKFNFSRNDENYSNVVQKSPHECEEIYDIFSKAVVLAGKQQAKSRE